MQKQISIPLKTNWIGQKIPEGEMDSYLKERFSELSKKHPDIKFFPVVIIWGKDTPSEGYIQRTIRPYVQGMGCDGTTDGHIHLIAQALVERLGGDYQKLQKEAYPKGGWSKETINEFKEWTVIPDEIDPSLVLADLYDINNRTLVDVLEAWLEKKLNKTIKW